MDRKKFAEKLKTAKPLSRDHITRVVSDSADSTIGDGNPRRHNNLIIVMEELAELSQEISKELRGKGCPVGLLEELTDVQVGIYYVQEIMGISDETLAKAVAVKIKRLESIMDTNSMPNRLGDVQRTVKG